MIKAVLFDLDNTLIDFMRMKRECCSAAVEAMINSGLGMGKKEALKRLFELYDKHGLEYSKIFQEFLQKTTGGIDYRILAEGINAYRKTQVGFLKPYPSVFPTLIKLRERGLKIGIVSDAPKLKAWLRLVEMGITDFFDDVVALEDTGKEKPSRLPFKKALEKLKTPAGQVLFVGDQPEKDIKGAKALGMKTAFARYGYIYKPKKSRADYEIDDVKDVLKIIKHEKNWE